MLTNSTPNTILSYGIIWKGSCFDSNLITIQCKSTRNTHSKRTALQKMFCSSFIFHLRSNSGFLLWYKAGKNTVHLRLLWVFLFFFYQHSTVKSKSKFSISMVQYVDQTVSPELSSVKMSCKHCITLLCFRPRYALQWKT